MQGLDLKTIFTAPPILNLLHPDLSVISSRKDKVQEIKKLVAQENEFSNLNSHYSELEQIKNASDLDAAKCFETAEMVKFQANEVEKTIQAKTPNALNHLINNLVQTLHYKVKDNDDLTILKDFIFNFKAAINKSSSLKPEDRSKLISQVDCIPTYVIAVQEYEKLAPADQEKKIGTIFSGLFEYSDDFALKFLQNANFGYTSTQFVCPLLLKLVQHNQISQSALKRFLFKPENQNYFDAFIQTIDISPNPITTIEKVLKVIPSDDPRLFNQIRQTFDKEFSTALKKDVVFGKMIIISELEALQRKLLKHSPDATNFNTWYNDLSRRWVMNVPLTDCVDRKQLENFHKRISRNPLPGFNNL